MKKIIVTGGAGFIGSHLCRKLVTDGNEVICIDNFYTGNKENINDLKGINNFEVIRHDMIEPILVEADEVYHLACPASPIHYQYDGVKTIKTNVLGTLNALGIAKRTGAKLLLTSTSEVYGDPLEHPQKESYLGNVNPIGIRACYDEGKRIAETLCMEYSRNYSVDIRIARIFNTYGTHMHPKDGRVVSNFINQALWNKDITIYGDGSQTRSFCYVSDMVTGLTDLMNQKEYIYPVNLGNPQEFKIIDLAKMILKKTKRESKIIFSDLPQDDPKIRKPDIGLAEKYLNFRPTVNLSDGIDKTIKYFDELMYKNM